MKNKIEKVINKSYITKLLKCIECDPQLFQKKEINFIVGFTTTQTVDYKRFCVQNKLIEEKKRKYFLTKEGKEFIVHNPLETWKNKEYFLRPEINLEYLKFDKPTSQILRAILLLTNHLITKNELKDNSIESYIKAQLFNDKSDIKKIKNDIKKYINKNNRFKLIDLYNYFSKPPYGLSITIIAVILFNVLIENKNKIAIYEKNEFLLEWQIVKFKKMVLCPEIYEIQNSEIENLPIIEKLSFIVLTEKSTNILDIAKVFIYFIKNLEDYTKNSKNINKKLKLIINSTLKTNDPIKLITQDIPLILCGKELKMCDETFVEEFKLLFFDLKKVYNDLLKDIKKKICKTFKVNSRSELEKKFKNIEPIEKYKLLFETILDKNIDDRLWIEKIAMYLKESILPKNWSESDIKIFDKNLKNFALEVLSLGDDVQFSEIMQSIYKSLLNLNECEIKAIFRKLINA